MAAAATAVKFHVRVSRLHETGVVFQEGAWLQEAAGDLVQKGKSLLDFVATTKSFSHGPSFGAAILGSSGFHLPSWPLKKSAAGTIPNSPVESLVANLSASRDHASSSKPKVQFVPVQTADGQALADSVSNVGTAKTDSRRSPLVQSVGEEDYGWETDPNGVIPQL